MTYLGESIPKLGFGLMRLPERVEGNKKIIEIDELCEMVDAFLAGGFSYFDTAYGYHGGRSEEAIKVSLVDRYPRERYQLATKLPAWSAKTAEDAKKMLATSLERTGVDYFDFYLLHNLGGSRTRVFEDYGLWDYLKEQKEKGVIKHLGFSIHDKAEALDEVLKVHPETDFVQLQINYADWESPVIESRKCYEVARAHNKPVIVMEPVRGGSLSKLPEQVASIFEKAEPEASLASWAIRYAASLEGVITVLSGMSTLSQVQDNVSFMKDFKPLSTDEYRIVEKAQKALSALPSVPCTDCRYCVSSCPAKVKIPNALNALNIYLVFGDIKRARESYGWTTEGGKASACIACGSCEKVCPQHIEIISELKRAAELLEA